MTSSENPQRFQQDKVRHVLTSHPTPVYSNPLRRGPSSAQIIKPKLTPVGFLDPLNPDLSNIRCRKKTLAAHRPVSLWLGCDCLVVVVVVVFVLSLSLFLSCRCYSCCRCRCLVVAPTPAVAPTPPAGQPPASPTPMPTAARLDAALTTVRTLHLLRHPAPPATRGYTTLAPS